MAQRQLQLCQDILSPLQVYILDLQTNGTTHCAKRWLRSFGSVQPLNASEKLRMAGKEPHTIKQMRQRCQQASHRGWGPRLWRSNTHSINLYGIDSLDIFNVPFWAAVRPLGMQPCQEICQGSVNRAAAKPTAS